MKTKSRFDFILKRHVPVALTLALALSAPVAASRDHAHQAGSSPQPPSRAAKNTAHSVTPAATQLPPLPAGVADLKFGEFFVTPVGPRGLELTEKLRGLEGQRVRILGYMAHRDVQPPGVFLLTPFPVQIHDHDNGLAEDFPVSVVQVSVPTLRDQPVPFVPGLMLLTGTLSLGNRPEPDGRVSLVRLELDPPPAVAKRMVRSTAKGAERLMSAGLAAAVPLTPALSPKQQGRGNASRH